MKKFERFLMKKFELASSERFLTQESDDNVE